jgi:GTPase SAR1 family protein
MDITEYERAKFELADLLRSASLVARGAQPKTLYPFEDLFARLADDRFNLAVVGQFSRGKSSLMNAILNTEQLPTGIVPLTSVITTVQYGTTECARIEFQEDRLPLEIPLESLSDYVTQRNNPGNAKRIKFAHVELPSELLRRGFYLVDTPGLGSAIIENTRTTEGFLPEADAFILVTSSDSPLSSEELRLLLDLGPNARRIFFVVNKQDLASELDRAEVHEHIRAQIRNILGENKIEIFSVSAREAMEANRLGDLDRLAASGLPAFMECLTHFLIMEKQTEFLCRMCERIEECLVELGNCAAEYNRLTLLQQQFSDTRFDARLPARAVQPAAARVVPRFTSCTVCARVERETYEFLRKYQYQVMIDQNVQQQLAEDGGLCPFHTWQYAAIASPHGTCVGFPGVHERLASHIRDLLNSADDHYSAAVDALVPVEASCALCRIRREAEHKAIADVSRLIAAAVDEGAAEFPDVCLPHVPQVIEAIVDSEVVQTFLQKQAESWERVAEDMRRYALKRDGLRRAFTTKDELDADQRGLIALAGHRNVNFVRKPR